MSFLSAYDSPVFEPLAAFDAHEDGDWAAAIASAAYGYSRHQLHSPLNAAVFGFFGYKWPLLAASALAVDALFNQEDTPLKALAHKSYKKWRDKRSTATALSGLPVWAR